MAETAARSASAGTACDVAGAVLLTASAAWAVYTAAGRDVGPEGQLLALLAVTAGYAAGRIAGAVAPLGSLVAAAGVVVLLPLALPGGLSGDPVALPLRQADADAALLALGAGACCAALRTARSAALRVVLGLVALGLVGESLATGSVAGFLACGGVLVVAAATGRTRRRGTALV
ncbi:O-antigen polymerase, partial [Streptacidiphilus monticola]